MFLNLHETGEMLADSTVTVSGLTSPSGHPNHPSPFLLPPPRALMMNPAAYLAAPFLYGNNALRYKDVLCLSVLGLMTATGLL